MASIVMVSIVMASIVMAHIHNYNEKSLSKLVKLGHDDGHSKVKPNHHLVTPKPPSCYAFVKTNLLIKKSC